MPLANFRGPVATEPPAPTVSNSLAVDFGVQPDSVSAGAQVQLSGVLLLVAVVAAMLLAWHWPV
jgi:hypothetical protein